MIWRFLIEIEFFDNIARNGGRIMQGLSAEKRSKIINEYAKLLLNNSGIIEEANNADLDLAKKNSMTLKYNISINKLIIFYFLNN